MPARPLSPLVLAAGVASALALAWAVLGGGSPGRAAASVLAWVVWTPAVLEGARRLLAGDARKREAGRWLLVVHALGPFALLYVWDVAHDPATFTGFLWNDFPHYVAQGREVFERGNGVLFPRAYAIDPAPPALYFSWIKWLLGAAVIVGVDPGAAFLALGVAGALACARVSMAVVETRLDDDGFVGAGFLLLLWGGGAFVVAALAFVDPHSSQTLGQQLHRFEPTGGFWFLSWGRNLLFPFEAVLHTLTMLAWWGALRDRPWVSTAAAALAVTSHPFTAVSLLAAWAPWVAWRAAKTREARFVGAAVVTLVLGVAFVAYQMVWLPTVPEHARLQALLEQPWTLPASAQVLAYAPVLVLAVLAQRARGRPRGEDLFLWLAFFVALALANHELVLRPRQPLHFTRGYVWTPLFLLALPWLRDAAARLARAAAAGRAWAGTLGVALFVLLCADNLSWTPFVGDELLRGVSLSQRLRPAERDLFRRIDELGLCGVVLSPSERVTYLSGTYTPLFPYVGHYLLTFDYGERLARARGWFLGDEGAIDVVDHVIIPRGLGFEKNLDGFELRVGNDDMALYSRTGAPLPRCR